MCTSTSDLTQNVTFLSPDRGGGEKGNFIYFVWILFSYIGRKGNAACPR